MKFSRTCLIALFFPILFSWGSLTNSSDDSAQFRLLTEPWKKYFREPPKILVIGRPSQGIESLLMEEQKLIQSVLDVDGSAKENSSHAVLEANLAELKTLIPGAETASGYVPGNSRRYSYIVGNTVYVRSSSYYYNGYYYGYLRQKSESSSPELLRSVRGLVHNATLEIEDMDQRINGLQSLISKWAERNERMSPNGTSGIIRRANEDYLTALRQFIQSMIQLRQKLQEAEAKQAEIKADRANVLANWQSFEQNRLPLLEEYLTENAVEIVEPDAAGDFILPKLSRGQKYLLRCRIGDRNLYFEVETSDSELHPFVLVDVSPL